METKTVKHTKGPWTLKPSEYGCAHEVSFNTTSYGMIARIFTPGFHYLPDAPNKQECLANARLIAAAPDLLEWAKYCERYLRHPDVKEVTRHFSVPPNLIALNQLISDAEGGE